jgi:hypothetical protein
MVKYFIPVQVIQNVIMHSGMLQLKKVAQNVIGPILTIKETKRRGVEKSVHKKNAATPLPTKVIRQMYKVPKETVI